jgi:hypothetical protein
MVRTEALRTPNQGDDRRTEQRATLEAWFSRNAGRIHIQPTRLGEDHARNMRNWVGGGGRPEDRPVSRNLGELTIAALLPIVNQSIGAGEALMLMVDDRAARALLAQAAQTEGLDADIMATETFLRYIAEDFGQMKAATAWQAISLASGGRHPESPRTDPVLIRKL